MIRMTLWSYTTLTDLALREAANQCGIEGWMLIHD